MNRHIPLVLALVCCISAAATTWAEEYGIGIRAGTQGLGLEGAVGIKKWVSLRGGVYGLEVSRDFDEGGIDYEADLQLGGVGLLADFFPARGQFRISAGLFANRTEIGLTAIPTEDIEIGGTTYTPAEAGTLRGKIDFDSTAPYLGIGWGNVADGRRVGFLFDLGVLAQGSGDVSLSSDSGLVDPADFAAEIDEIEGEIEDYDLWPVISFGIAIRI